jgi:hypothetical protein
MFYSRRQLFSVLLLALYALVHPFSPASAVALDDRDAVPDDFKIFAQYGPGYSDWKAWKTTITGRGEVTQDVRGKVDWESEKLPSLTQSDLKELLAKIKEADFFKLEKNYKYNVTDNPTLILKITMNKKTHEVSVYAPRHLKKEEGVKSFLKVWDELLKKAPSPNPEQKPEKP